MPRVNGKFVASTSQLDGLSPLEPLRQNFNESGQGYFEPVYKRFPGFVDDYKDYIDSPTSTPLNSDFNEIRALNQGTGEKLGRSFGKFAVNATSTALDGTIGLFTGLANMGGEKTGFEGNLEEFIDNPFSRAVQEWADETRQGLEVYRTKAYEEGSVLSNAFSAEGIGNFWGDTIFSNAGYAVGAIATGLGFGSALKAGGKAVAKSYLRNTLKRSGLEISEALKAGQTVEQVVDKALKGAKVRQWGNTINQGVTSALSSIGEARMEAFDAEKQVIDNLKAQGVWDGLTKEEQDNITQNTKNTVFGANMAILTMSNAIQFGKAFSKPFAESNLGYKIFKEGEKYAADPYNKFLGLPTAIAKLSGTEALEEGSQFAISETEKHYQSKRAQDPEAEGSFNEYMNSVLYGLGQLNTKEGWENMVSGALIGGMMPAGSSYKNSKGQEVKGLKTLIPGSNIAKNISEQKIEAARNQGMASELNDLKDTAIKSRKALNERIGKDMESLRAAMGKPVEDQDSEQIKILRETIVRSMSLQTDMAKDIATGNFYEFKNKESQDLANLAFGFIKTGRLEDFKEFMESSSSMSAEQIKEAHALHITDLSTGKSDKIDTSEAKSPEQLVNEHKEKIDSLLKDIDKAAEYYDKVNKITGGKLNNNAQLDLVSLMFSQHKAEKRITDLNTKLTKNITESISNKNFGIRVDDTPVKSNKTTLEAALKDKVESIKERLDPEVSLMDAVNDLSSNDPKVRAKAVETLTDILKSKTINDVLELKDGLTTKELLTDITDLAKLNSDRRFLAKAISSAFNDPSKFNQRTLDQEDYSLGKDFETNNFPFIQNYKKERLAIDALEAAAEDIILDNEKQAEINFENPQGPLEEISEEIIAGQIKFDDNFDQTKYKDWTTFIRTTGNQTSVTPNSPEYHWYKWFLPNKNLSEFTFITQSVGTVLPELRDKLGFWIQSLNEGKGGFMTVAEIGDNAALLQEAESNVRVIVFKKNGELVVDPSNNPISTSLSLPEYKYTNPDSPRLGEIRFATSHLEEALIEEGLTPEEAEEVIENTLKRGAEEYGKWLEGVKKNKTQLNINGLNPGARNGNLKMQPVGIVGGVLTEVEYKELEKNSDLLNIFIETYIGEGNAKVVDTVINGTTFKVYAGLPYVIVNGVPTALRKTTLTEKDITRTVELLKFAAKNPDKFKMIEDHIKTYINTFSREGKPSNYRFYLFQTKSGFTVNYGTNKFITSEQLLSGDVQGLKDFLATKEYNIDKKTLNAENSTYTKLDIKNGSLVFDTYTHYKMWIADPNESKFAIRSYPIPMDQSGELDFDRYLNEAPRLNPTLQF